MDEHQHIYQPTRVAINLFDFANDDLLGLSTEGYLFKPSRGFYTEDFSPWKHNVLFHIAEKGVSMA